MPLISLSDPIPGLSSPPMIIAHLKSNQDSKEEMRSVENGYKRHSFFIHVIELESRCITSLFVRQSFLETQEKTCLLPAILDSKGLS